jgi:hypothetical protein
MFPAWCNGLCCKCFLNIVAEQKRCKVPACVSLPRESIVDDWFRSGPGSVGHEVPDSEQKDNSIDGSGLRLC